MSTVGLKRNHHNIVGAARAGALEQIRDAGVCVWDGCVCVGGGSFRAQQHNTTTTTTTEINKRKENGDGRGDFFVRRLEKTTRKTRHPQIEVDKIIFVDTGQ